MNACSLMFVCSVTSIIQYTVDSPEVRLYLGGLASSSSSSSWLVHMIVDLCYVMTSAASHGLNVGQLMGLLMQKAAGGALRMQNCANRTLSPPSG
jgi:hypothetical protein